METLSEGHFPLLRYSYGYRRRDGARQELRREVYRIGHGAAVLPFDPRRGTVLLTRQFRLPAHVNGDRPWLVEACAGNVEEGDDPAETARKEAEQEMGCALGALREAFALYVSPGATAEKLHLFTAEYDPGGRSGAGGGLREEGEEIETFELPLAEAWAMVGRGEIVDAKTVLLLQHLLLLGHAAAPATAPSPARPPQRRFADEEGSMAESGRPGEAPERPEPLPAGRDQGDAAPPGVASGDDREEGGRSGAADRDPGDSVPPGVAPLEPPEPTEEDRRVLEKLRDLPRRGGG